MLPYTYPPAGGGCLIGGGSAVHSSATITSVEQSPLHELAAIAKLIFLAPKGQVWGLVRGQVSLQQGVVRKAHCLEAVGGRLLRRQQHLRSRKVGCMRKGCLPPGYHPQHARAPQSRCRHSAGTAGVLNDCSCGPAAAQHRRVGAAAVVG